jgi:hypothetical protein
MTLKVIDMISAPGGSQPNEDRVGSSGVLGWVIDGATSLELSPFLPAESDVQWLVDYIDRQFQELGRAELPATGRQTLMLVKERVAKQLTSLRFPDDRIQPTCSVGICIETEPGLEFTRVGDVTCVSVGETITELSTMHFSRIEASAVRSFGGPGISTTARAGILERRMRHIRGIDGESVFSGHPEGRVLSHSALIEQSGPQQILICSDGFARAINDYHLYTCWAELVADALSEGLNVVLEKIRRFEQTSDSTGHFKVADDVSALLVTSF